MTKRVPTATTRLLVAAPGLALALASLSACGSGDAEPATAQADASAEAQPRVFIEEMTWTEIRDAVASGATTVVLPTAGTEQNGPHMVMGKHRYIVEEASKRIARELGNALVAPALGFAPFGSNR